MALGKDGRRANRAEIADISAISTVSSASGQVRHLPLARSQHETDLASAENLSLQDGEKLLLVGDIAKASGKTVRAIHHYEEIGLLQPHARSKGRYRLYDQAALARVRWIGKLHDLGLSLGEIQQMVRAWETAPSAPGAMATMRGLYHQKLEETRAQLAHLANLERELVASLEYLSTCDTCDPLELVRACSRCNLHEQTTEPELVAGIHGGNGHTCSSNGRHQHRV